MKITYRGVSYDYEPPTVAVQEGAVAGKFRGLDWRFHNLKKPLTLQPPVNLTYRGVAYFNRPTATQEATPASVNEKSRWLILNRAKAAKNRNDSMLRRTAYEVGLA
ncbi:MAG: DUF4278 domain-containing protein [Xenococcaceae cyanobacterium MO_234.B1]|nr:DUF4278 domain-containing protein [Xenococcaceae cyanobacterium MO_234.B1]